MVLFMYRWGTDIADCSILRGRNEPKLDDLKMHYCCKRVSIHAQLQVPQRQLLPHLSLYYGTVGYAIGP